jgi:hypothetical protein
MNCYELAEMTALTTLLLVPGGGGLAVPTTLLLVPGGASLQPDVAAGQFIYYPILL